jgi:hypothetical protein
MRTRGLAVAPLSLLAATHADAQGITTAGRRPSSTSARPARRPFA